jgi:hypothetical protein
MYPSDLFLASYYSTKAAVYFNRVLLVSNLAQHPDPRVSALREVFFQKLRDSGRYYVENIKQANEIYLEMNLPALDLPRLPNDYFAWLSEFRANLRNTTTDQSNEQLIIDYAFYMASISTDLALLNWSKQLHLEAPLATNQFEQIESSINDIKNTKFNWAAFAMLLGKNDQLRFFWEEWQSLDHLLEQYLAFDVVNKPENTTDSMRFSEALLPKFDEKATQIFNLLQAD